MPKLALNKEHDKEVGKRSVLNGRRSVEYYFKRSRRPGYDEEVGKRSVLSGRRSVQYYFKRSRRGLAMMKRSVKGRF